MSAEKLRFNRYLLGRGIWKLFWYILLIGISFIILYPFIIKLSSMFMSVSDTYDDTVALIPKTPTLDNIKYIFANTPIIKAYINTAVNSTAFAGFTVVTSTLVGYGLAKFTFYGKKIIITFVLLSLLIPFSTVLIPTYMQFRYFDIFGLIKLITGQAVSTINTPFPLWFLAATGFGFRSGLYILIMMQAFKGLPKELDEAGMVDGASPLRLFISINVPLVRSMSFVVLILSFAWQWTDTLYNNLLLPYYDHFPRILALLSAKTETALGSGTYVISLLKNGALLLIIIPLLIVFIISQRQLVQGIERAGLVG